MANTDNYDADVLLKTLVSNPDFTIDGIHFGRGNSYYNETTSTQLKHKTKEVKCWRIVNENLEEIENLINNFYSSETYLIQWKSVTDSFRFNTDDVLSRTENEIYFYWKGEDASKGYSPLPESIEKGNPPVERTVQWAEPPAFLQLFCGGFVVHNGKHNNLNLEEPHLYISRGEMEKETHLYEVPLKKESLRSRTSFVLHFPKEKSSVIWHGNKSNTHTKNVIKQSTEKIFGPNFTEIDESSENDTFLRAFKEDGSEYLIHSSKIIDYTPRLFYLNKITGTFAASEIECSHRSSYLTPFPFLQSHLYTADQPAIFLLDDNDEIWIWYGWQRDEDDEFKTECFITAINYAKQKSKLLKKLVKVQKVIAGFEPNNFTNLFPLWKKREDIAELQEKDGVLPNTNPLIEVISHEENSSKN